MFEKIKKMFFKSKTKDSIPENGVDLNLNIFIKKPSTQTSIAEYPMIIISKRKAKKFQDEFSRAVAGSEDFVRINIKGEINPKKETAEDYSFIIMEEMKGEE